MKTIIACLDGSAHAENVITMAAWAAGQTGASISLLHMVPSHSEAPVLGDLSGQIGLGAKSDLLEELTKIEQEHGKLEQKKGQLILSHAKEALTNLGAKSAETLHRRGELVDEIQQQESEADLIIIGKRGETKTDAQGHVGANLERVSRAVHKPLLIATHQSKPVERFLVAYDGRASSDKAVDFAVSSPLFKGLDCHLLKVGADNSLSDAILRKAKTKLEDAGFTVKATIADVDSVDKAVTDYITENGINMLLMGAYGHSPLRRFFLGSTTMAQISQSKVPVLLFR